MFILTSSLWVFNSCSIQKRKHLKGWHITTKRIQGKSNSKEKQEETSQSFAKVDSSSHQSTEIFYSSISIKDSTKSTHSITLAADIIRVIVEN